MGRPRSELQALLATFGAKKVYFQPPSNASMEYPCICYELEDESVQYADDSPYRRNYRYMVTVIDRNPDSAIKDLVAQLPYCAFNRFFAADNLNHFVYNLYF